MSMGVRSLRRLRQASDGMMFAWLAEEGGSGDHTAQQQQVLLVLSWRVRRPVR